MRRASTTLETLRMGESKRRHQLGDAPIEAQYVEKMNALAHAIDELFNGDAIQRARPASS
jgi:hypothetical protein